jgi:hypothetical protein
MHPTTSVNGNGNGQISNTALFNSDKQHHAPRKGTKSSRTTGTTTEGADTTTGRGVKLDPNASSMQPAAQDSGAINAPGVHNSG